MIPRLRMGRVVGPEPLRAVVVPGQVDQLAADLGGGQAEEVACRRRGDRPQGAVQADQGVLGDVVALLPAGDAGVALEHLAGQPRQPVTGAAQQRRPCRFVAVAEAIDTALDDGGVSSRAKAWSSRSVASASDDAGLGSLISRS